MRPLLQKTGFSEYPIPGRHDEITFRLLPVQYYEATVWGEAETKHSGAIDPSSASLRLTQRPSGGLCAS